MLIYLDLCIAQTATLSDKAFPLDSQEHLLISPDASDIFFTEFHDSYLGFLAVGKFLPVVYPLHFHSPLTLQLAVEAILRPLSLYASMISDFCISKSYNMLTGCVGHTSWRAKREGSSITAAVQKIEDAVD